MEVHAHTHTERKKWTHYIWEFLMLFLAVFCGFLAENQREHIIEQKREKQYINSFCEDLATDETDLQAIIDRLYKHVIIADSLELLMNKATKKTPANQIYMYLRTFTRSSGTLLTVNDRTIVQLRNAGGMRLIQNKNVSDSIVGYYKEIELIQFLNEESITMKRSLREKLSEILNSSDYARIIDTANRIINPNQVLYLRSTDENSINYCLMKIDELRGLSSGLRMRIQRLKERAAGVRRFIAKAYHLN